MAQDPALVPEASTPPLSARHGLVCPLCYEQPTDELVVPSGGKLLRCAKHGLAYVDAGELLASGSDPMLGRTVAGRFTVIARIGTGSMGAVYRARQEAFGRDVALKIVRPDRAFDPETKTRFSREARATSKLTSPHTVTAFDFGEADDGSWFLAMQLLEGETLGERLRRLQRLAPSDAVRIAREALKSLAEAHNKGIIHRDLKPDNLFLTKLPTDAGTPGGEICKVLDFGIAKHLHGEEQKVDQLETQAGTVFGTPRYMSPEQAQGTKLDNRSDLYSLGVMLYQMLAGRAPFIDDDAVVVMARHIKDDPPAFSAIASGVPIPAALERVIRRALAKNAADRPQSAEQFIAELDAAVEDLGAQGSGFHSTSWASPSLPVVAAEKHKRERSRSRIALAIAAAAFVCVIAIVAASSLSAPPRVATLSAWPPIAAIRPNPAAQQNPPAADVEPAAPAVSGAPAPAPKTEQRAAPRRRSPAPQASPRRSPERYGRFE